MLIQEKKKIYKLLFKRLFEWKSSRKNNESVSRRFVRGKSWIFCEMLPATVDTVCSTVYVKKGNDSISAKRKSIQLSKETVPNFPILSHVWHKFPFCMKIYLYTLNRELFLDSIYVFLLGFSLFYRIYFVLSVFYLRYCENHKWHAFRLQMGWFSFCGVFTDNGK